MLIDNAEKNPFWRRGFSSIKKVTSVLFYIINVQLTIKHPSSFYTLFHIQCLT